MLVNKQDIKYTLWFDVEERYKTNNQSFTVPFEELWFDVEERYKTNLPERDTGDYSCGLM